MQAVVPVRRIPPEVFGPTLRAARAAVGLGLREAARAIGIHSSYLSALEAGRRCPSRTVAEQIAAALAVDEDTRVVLFSAAVAGVGRDHPARTGADAWT
ncbi:helix-turn-helix domain-containing protein [Streptomyces sp. NPDC020817]|uniref:helix-turn-helix domain-containing protein n=1 Tax=Streptomyces sp. NPDC020817 TaxID=3365095 RepID=UPI00378D1039